MTIMDIRSKSTDELISLVKEMRMEFTKLRMKKNLGVIEAAAKVALVRKNIARIETIIKEKNRMGKVNA